jgi:endonuclease YncB( thermonuclease family)
MKKIIFVIALVLFTNLPVLAADYSFPDVQEDHSNFEAIIFLRDRGVIDGYDNGNFGPDDPVSRVQALKILLLGSNIDPAENICSDFPDVPSTHWGQRFIAEAANRGIVSGNSDGTFRADATMNRAEALKIILLANDISPVIPVVNPFIDVNVNDWFVSFAEYAKNKKLVDSAEVFLPAEELTRGDFVELMYRLAYINENELDYFQATDERKVFISSVYDGDTFTTSMGEKIRLIGVDTPEKGEDFDPAATELVKSLILDQEVTIKVCSEKRDRYGRTLAQVFTVDNSSIAEELIKNGLAEEYIPSSCGAELEDEYLAFQSVAQNSQIGIWADYLPELESEQEAEIITTDFGECNSEKYCTDMESCEEAMYFLEICGFERLDQDSDGIPCESICLP